MVAGRYCFDVDAFAADEFSVAAFLEECRARNPMETVHQDLRDFQTSLENQVQWRRRRRTSGSHGSGSFVCVWSSS